jgi:hypothetical protein
MKSEISASFTLTGLDLNPDEITDKLKIIPTKIWRKGDLINPKGKIFYSENGWSLQSQLNQSAELEDHLQWIFEKLQTQWDSVREICSRYYPEISCVIYVSNQVPAIHFSQEILQEVNQLNAEIDVDIYVLPESNEWINSQELKDRQIRTISNAR